MHFRSFILGLAGADAAAAAAIPAAEPQSIKLAADDIILYGASGKHQIMKRDEWQAIEEARLASLNTRAAERGAVSYNPSANAGGLAKRADCTDGAIEELQILNTEHFLQWDIVMSPVITARYNKASVAVTKGYSVANSVSVTESMSYGLTQALSASLQISFSQTWTTENSQTYSYDLEPVNGTAMHGCVVSNPVTTRYSGNYLTGCNESPTVTPYSATVYAQEVKSNEFTWVEGAIGLTASTQYPVPCLIGECEHK